MLEEIIIEIKNKIDKILNDYQNELLKTESEFKKQEIVKEKINKILSEYSNSKVINFDLLDYVIKILSKKGVEFENINYKGLYDVRKELVVNFPDRVSSIDSKFDNLINILKSYMMRDVKEYQNLKREISKYTSEIDKYRKLKKVIDKVQIGNIISVEEIKLLDEISNFYYDSLEELYIFIVKNNFNQMQKAIDIEKRKVKERALNEKLRKAREEAERVSSVNNDKEKASTKVNVVEHVLNEEEKKLINNVQDIIRENDISDKTFLQLMTGENIMNILEFVDSIGDAKNNIALVLNDIILPLINSGEIKNVEEILNAYISKYELVKKEEELLKRKYDIEYKLNSINRGDILLNYKKAQKIINTELEKSQIGKYFGYLSTLTASLNALKFAIYDDEIFGTELFESTYHELLERLKEVESVTFDEPDDKKDEFLDSREFYNGATNLIFFPTGIDFSKQIDEDETLQQPHKKRVLHGLKKLSLDDNIFSSSRHKIKDDNIEKYKTLRRYKGTDYRIVYKVSRASGLEKIFGKKMNVIFALNVGYGATSEKVDFYNEAKNTYDTVESEITEIINILNSDNEQEIRELIDIQLSKLEKYIKACTDGYVDSASIKGGGHNE